MQINIPQEKKQDIIDAFCSVYNYQEEIELQDLETEEITMIPNPQSKADFTKNELLRFIRNVYESHKAAETEKAKQTAISDAKTYTNNLTVT